MKNLIIPQLTNRWITLYQQQQQQPNKKKINGLQGFFF